MPIFDLVLRNGTLALPDGFVNGDLAVRDGRIVAIGKVDGEAEQVLDCHGLLVMPGAIDTQVHFREPGLEHKEDLESGTRAALHGGVTTIFEMPNTNPNTTTKEALEDKLARCVGRAWVNHAFFVGAAVDNTDRLAELEMLPGTPGVKIFMGSSTGTLLVDRDEDLRQVLLAGKRRCPIHAEDEARNRERKALISDHPHAREHPFLRDAESAKIATERILRLSAETGRPVHVLHISTRDELPLLAEGKKIRATCEITPQHLWFAAPDCYDRLGTLAQMNPPMRSEEHRAGLRQAYQDGVFAVIGSDHAPHTLEEKAKPYPQSPSGMPGVQTLLPVMFTLAAQGIGTDEQVVRMSTEAPAALYGIRDRGSLKVGFHADIACIDLNSTFQMTSELVESKCGWTPYEGEHLRGIVRHVVVGGQVRVQDQERHGVASGQAVEFDWK